ncbi:MAG: CotH kinase family protein [Lachnospiraceae bacterium]|nr:CotH kinase family protein [Lachnospiraceae bacterium]
MKLGSKYFKYIIVGACTLFLLLLLLFAPRAKADSGLVIYDVRSDSPRIVKDDGSIEFSDYVRIKNVNESEYDLSGLFLSDSRRGGDRLPLDGIVLFGGESILVKLDPSWNFALKNTGDENVYLSDARGNIIFKYTSDMKPMMPEMSAESGIYDEEFALTVLAPDGNAIYYTLDGCEPDENSMKYTSPIKVHDISAEPNTVVSVANIVKNYLEDEYDGIPIAKPIEEPVDKAFVVRAAAIDEYGNRSDIATRVFFFTGDKYRNIISVVADRDDLFGDYGIVSVGKEYDEWYLGGQEGDAPEVNFNKKGREWEVPADMDYFRDGKEVLSEKCGLKLFGRTTRDERVKNFQLRARDNYSGSDVFGYDFFDAGNLSDRVTLDDSFIESFFFSLVSDEEIITHATTDRAALFINGEFWNSIYIRQKFDEKFFLDNYGIDPGNLIVLNDTFPEIGGDDEASYEEARQLYLAIDDFAAANDLSLDENYEQLQTMVDIDSYIDYIAINTWAGNNDWDEFTNSMCWRVRKPYDSGYGDGRFRFMLHDGDIIFNDVISIMDQDYIDGSPLLKGLMTNESFREKLSARLVELGNTSFSDAHIKEELSDEKWDEPEKELIAAFFETRKEKILRFAEDLIDED